MSYASQSILKYRPTDKSYGHFAYSVMRANNNGDQVRQYKSVSKYDGDIKQIHQLFRDTLKRYNSVATESAWSDEVKFANFQEDILCNDAKDLWDEALEEGNGPGDPIDPENPNADDFDMVVINFVGKIADQENPQASTFGNTYVV